MAIKSKEYALPALPLKPELGAHYYIPNGDGDNVDHYIGTCDDFRLVGKSLPAPLQVPDATETVKGIAEIATSGEVLAGTDHTRIVTPLTLNERISAIPAHAPDSYVHEQGVAADTWVITHNMGFHPNVSVVDSTGRKVYGSIDYNNINQLTATFAGAFAGRAYLS